MSAISVLKEALKQAEARRDDKAEKTKDIRTRGAEAQEAVNKLEDDVQDIILAIDMLERPERFVERATEEKTLQQRFADAEAEVGHTLTELPPEAYERPEVEEMQVAGVRVIRRPADV